MRIATASAFDSAIDTLQRRQTELVDSQVRLTSGKRVQRGSDDPTDAARGERALASLARLDATARAVSASRNAMQLTDSALGDAANDLQRARELMVAAGNGTYSDGERAAIAVELKGIRDQLLATANRGDGSGGYLFGGQGSASQPFVDSPTGVRFDGVRGAAQVSTGEGLPIAVDGDYTWMRATGAGSVFDTLDQAINDLNTASRTPAAIAASNAQQLGGLDASLDRLQSVRAQVGGVLNRLESIDGRVAEARVNSETERSVATDLDFTEAISDFQNRQAGYDAALKSYAMVQRMTLFQYIGG